MSEKRYDVIIYEIKTREVVAVPGRDMKLDGRYNSATTRRETVLGRINQYFRAIIVPTGKFKEGDTLPANIKSAA